MQMPLHRHAELIAPARKYYESSSGSHTTYCTAPSTPGIEPALNILDSIKVMLRICV